jgi:hypothetical protein
VNKEMSFVLRRRRDAVRRKRREKWRSRSWFLLHDKAPADRSVLIKGFLANNNVRKLEHSPYSPNLAPAEFHLFAQVKSILKGRRFF